MGSSRREERGLRPADRGHSEARRTEIFSPAPAPSADAALQPAEGILRRNADNVQPWAPPRPTDERPAAGALRRAEGPKSGRGPASQLRTAADSASRSATPSTSRPAATADRKTGRAPRPTESTAQPVFPRPALRAGACPAVPVTTPTGPGRGITVFGSQASQEGAGGDEDAVEVFLGQRPPQGVGAGVADFLEVVDPLDADAGQGVRVGTGARPFGRIKPVQAATVGR